MRSGDEPARKSIALADCCLEVVGGVPIGEAAAMFCRSSAACRGLALPGTEALVVTTAFEGNEEECVK